MESWLSEKIAIPVRTLPAQWQQLYRDLERLLLARGISSTSARTVARAITELCRDYRAFLEYSRSYPPDQGDSRFKEFLADSDALGSKLIRLLNVSKHSGFRTLTPEGFVSWTASDKKHLIAELEKLTLAARLFLKKQKPPRGRRTDRNRKDLEMSVARTLAEFHISPTTAKSGTLARVFELVHAAIGLTERDPHKAVRKVCAALRLDSVTVPQFDRN